MRGIQEQVYNRSPTWLQNLLVSAYGYRLYKKRYTGIFHEILDLLREARDWTPQQVEDWQAEQLHNMVRHCRLTVPYYQKLFADHSLHENDFTTTKDVQKLPILTKAALKANIDDFRSFSGETYLVQHTSGSTGSPLALEVDEYTYKLAMALVVDHEESHGVRFGERRATFAGRMIQSPDNMHGPFSRYNRAENQRLYSSYHLNTQTFPTYRRDLDRFAPKEIIGYPSAISDLAGHYLASSQTPAFQPTAIITNSETLLSWQREQIESAFQCKIYDYYGTAEYVAFAGQNGTGKYIVSPVIGIMELLPSHAQPEETGTITATSLTNKIMPLLRYQLGDTAIPYSSQEGSFCTRSLEAIVGRTDDYIITPDGRNVGRVDHFFKGIRQIREAQVIQDRMDHCTVMIVANERLGEKTIDRLRSNIASRIGSNMKFDIKEVENIPKGANGKLRSVVRRLENRIHQ